MEVVHGVDVEVVDEELPPVRKKELIFKIELIFFFISKFYFTC